VILLPVRVIRTWTGPYCVWAVAPVTVRVVGAAGVVFGAEGALLVLVGAADAECDGFAEDDGVCFFSGVFDGDGDADAACADAEACAVSVGAGVSACASPGSVVGFSASSSTMLETAPAPASRAWRNGCFFLTAAPAHQR
jgi:hypothetical protein